MGHVLPRCVVPKSWGDRGVQLAHGERPDSTIVAIADVPSGLACGCVCPGCGVKLVAHKGQSTEHHFKHYNAGECANALESALHKLAKQVLDKDRRLKLPAVSAEQGDRDFELHKAAIHEFDGALLEHRLGNVVPDVLVVKDGHELLVEMFVTNRCGPEKIAKIVARRLSCVEIDLRRLPRDANEEQIREALLETAKRHWVHNPRIAVARERLEEMLAAEEEARRIKAEKAERRRQEELSRLAAQVAKVWTKTTAATVGTPEAVTLVRAFRFDDYVGLDVGGDGAFAWEAAHWQAQLLIHRVFPIADKGQYCSDSLIPSDLVKHLGQEGAFKPGQKTYFSREDEAYLAARVEGFQSPFASVTAYLDRLVRLGMLVRNRGHWMIRQSFLPIWTQQRDRRVARVEDAAEIDTLLNKILAAIPLNERTGFVLQRYWAHRLPDMDRSIADLLETDDSRVWGLIQDLRKIDAMLSRQGPVVDDLLGLPAQPARLRCVDAQEARAAEARLQAQKQAEDEAALRLASLTRAAEESLGETARVWLVTAAAGSSQTAPRTLATQSPEGLEHALSLLLREERVLAANRTATRWQGEVLDFAEKTSKPDLARAFLRNPHPLFSNRRPIESCHDEASASKLKEKVQMLVRRGRL